MAPQEKDNYFKLVALIVDIACCVIWKYIKEKILGPDSFETFLNKERHKLIHIYETCECCECMLGKITGERLISRKQLLILYKSEDRKKISAHKKYARGKLTNICICNYSAIANIDVKVVDITLAYYIIKKCGKNEQGIDNWIEQIKDVRNEIFHLSDIQAITDDMFSRKWTKLKGAIEGIAKMIKNTYGEETERKIIRTRNLTIIGGCMLKYEILCRDYWRNKCAEFERSQIEEIEKNAKILHTNFPKVFTKNMERDCQKTMQDIHSKRVHVPVFLQLDLPVSWNRTRILEYLDEIRLNETSEMNIKIIAVSPDDLNIYSEIARRVLCKVDLLRDAVNNMMSGMISEMSIDTNQNAEVGVNVTIPDNTENQIETNSEDDIANVEHAANDTPTEIELDDEQNEKNSEDGIDQADNISVYLDDQIRKKRELDDEWNEESDDETHQAGNLPAKNELGK
ncbi:Hypothetical predicted protein [Mytilus galloprovincialis]|uniref:DZIP3-like HEPN domain-containing protein n=1 Tax=Mytilus galloprovincialis TaxID=29158 RepID=A0A8B6DE66_MYTGA|nr:Hypothetical predicted protein [Mytilus galloprovincialis]